MTLHGLLILIPICLGLALGMIILWAILVLSYDLLCWVMGKLKSRFID